MRIYLTDDAEIDVEVEIERFEGDICAKTSVLPLVTEGVRSEGTISLFHHQDHWIEDTWDSGGR